MATVVIRQSRKTLYGMAIFSGLIILYYCIKPTEDGKSLFEDSPKFTVSLGVVLFGILIYSVSELIMEKGEIILSDDGIDIRSKGWNHWDYVNSFRTILERDSENSDKEYLVIHLKDGSELKCITSNLDRSREEIIDLIKSYKSDICYLGHDIQ